MLAAEIVQLGPVSLQTIELPRAAVDGFQSYYSSAMWKQQQRWLFGFSVAPCFRSRPAMEDARDGRNVGESVDSHN